MFTSKNAISNPRLQIVSGCPSQVLMVSVHISTACPSHGEEGADRVDLHVDAYRVASYAHGTYMDDRRNRSVLIAMVAEAGIVGDHNGSHCHAVWLHLWIFACPQSLSHRDASPFFAGFLDTPPDAPCD
jgi:hypothetical protein